MTVKELKELIEKVPDDYQVCYEYDGPETNCDVEATAIYLNQVSKRIVLYEEQP